MIKTAFLVVLPFLLSSKRFKPITTEYNVQTSHLVSATLNVLSGTKNDIWDKERYQGQKTISGTYRLCPPILNLIKAQVCDNQFFSISTHT